MWSQKSFGTLPWGVFAERSPGAFSGVFPGAFSSALHGAGELDERLWRGAPR